MQVVCRFSLSTIRDAGKWNEDTMGHNYATSPSPQTAAMTAGFQSAQHVFPKHALLEAPADIRALMFPEVIMRDDGTGMNIQQALAWAKTPEVRAVELPFSLCTCHKERGYQISSAGAREESNGQLCPYQLLEGGGLPCWCSCSGEPAL